ncbi:uncharacterized protein LOC101784606 isoform X1 [Setaria italica]|uniref:Uncharacterized protein n=1 Tax=Setaria italica TaxID=4555 RepID=K3XML7_SETIT|nr:uncharacterized protein LOC101784606 isoform X1 [Setaria italica]XP_004970772.1 uncharacterized protein LOC101784606 isoform X1 [Setaria italica]
MSGSGQRSRPWPGDPASTPSEPAAAVAAAADARGEASTLRDFGTSMDAISFGFAATAILISLFLLMAIFEHLIKPRAFPPDSPDAGRPRAVRHRHGRSPGKLRSPPMHCSSFHLHSLHALPVTAGHRRDDAGGGRSHNGFHGPREAPSTRARRPRPHLREPSSGGAR